MGGSWLGFFYECYMSVGGVLIVCIGCSVKEFFIVRSWFCVWVCLKLFLFFVCGICKFIVGCCEMCLVVVFYVEIWFILYWNCEVVVIELVVDINWVFIFL